MLTGLIKKQLTEVFRSYFINPKKNEARSKAGTVGMFILFGFLMIVVLGGMFAFLGYTMCAPLVQAGVGWLYFVIFGLIATLLGVFGSVFSTFSGLYLAKDNDLLLSMPIPVRDIILSRLANVYLMSLMYVAVVLVPVSIVYWIFGVCNAAAVVGAIVLLLLVSVFVTLLSCLLGWVVAKLSLKLKNKSYVTVLLALLGIGLYYFLYFKAQTLLRELVNNAAVYGAQVRGSANALYLFGRVGEGDWLAMLLFMAVVALLAGPAAQRIQAALPVLLLDELPFLHAVQILLDRHTPAVLTAVHDEARRRHGAGTCRLAVLQLAALLVRHFQLFMRVQIQQVKFERRCADGFIDNTPFRVPKAHGGRLGRTRSGKHIRIDPAACRRLGGREHSNQAEQGN